MGAVDYIWYGVGFGALLVASHQVASPVQQVKLEAQRQAIERLYDDLERHV